MKQSGRDAEFTAFMAGASASLARTAWLLTGDSEAAAELLQATLVKAYVAWPRIRQDDAVAYARRVMVNHNVDRFRARRRTTPVAVPPDLAVADATQQFAERDSIGRLLAGLPLRQRQVVVLRYLHDLSEKQVAAELDLPLGTVKSAGARGLAALRELMERDTARSEG
jgi:RNA polymerase sigma-70 factor (sigma-E family)